MKDADRATALQILKEKFPERYRELVEQYYKSLASEKAAAPNGGSAPKEKEK